MDVHDFSEKAVLLTDLSPYVYGTTRLGDDKISFDERVEMAKAAIDTGIWFHTSYWYGNALDVLNAAFNIDRVKVPKLIVKLGGETVDEFKADIQKNFNPMGINSIELGQLCLGGQLANDFANGGDFLKELERIKKSKAVNRFVLEVFPWTSHIALKALKGGYAKGLVDGVIFYLNPLQRFASNELWDLITNQYEPIIAMRTVAGGPVHRLRDEPGFAWQPYLQKRAEQVAPIFEKSGVSNWTEFCVRFAMSFPQVRATVGSTANAENLEQFLLASESNEPLADEIVNEIVALQYLWSDQEDMKAEPWTM